MTPLPLVTQRAASANMLEFVGVGCVCVCLVHFTRWHKALHYSGAQAQAHTPTNKQSTENFIKATTTISSATTTPKKLHQPMSSGQLYGLLFPCILLFLFAQFRYLIQQTNKKNAEMGDLIMEQANSTFIFFLFSCSVCDVGGTQICCWYCYIITKTAHIDHCFFFILSLDKAEFHSPNIISSMETNTGH